MAADNRDPPPLFDEDVLKDEENDDLFASAVQSPVNGTETPEQSVVTEIGSRAVMDENNAYADHLPSVSDASVTSSHPLTDPLQALGSFESKPDVTNPAGEDAANFRISSSNDSQNPDLIDSLSSNISNLPPVPRNMYNISSIDSMGPQSMQDSNMDLFESCLEDSFVKPLSSVSLADNTVVPQHQDINTEGCPGIDDEFANKSLLREGAVSDDFENVMDNLPVIDLCTELKDTQIFDEAVLNQNVGKNLVDIPVLDDQNLVDIPVLQDQTLVDIPVLDDQTLVEKQSHVDDFFDASPSVEEKLLDTDTGINTSKLPTSTEKESNYFTIEKSMNEETEVKGKDLDEIVKLEAVESSDSSLDDQSTRPIFDKVKAPLKKQESHFLTDDETTEISLSDNPFSNTSKEVSLDDDDDGLFSGSGTDSSKISDDTVVPATVLPPVGVPITPPAVETTPSMPSTYNYSANTPAAQVDLSPTNSQADPDQFIEISISEPQKVGDGMGSYMAYKMTTRTNIPFFKKQSWSVTRRFSDYLGLHSKLVEKHLHAGKMIPPAPEKDAVNSTKLKLGTSDSTDGAAEFLERRRATLQRFMQRTSSMAHLRSDPDFREFIELDSELPKATQTSAMSGAGVMRFFNKMGETVNKIAFKMEESDQWFEDRVNQMEALEVELRRLHLSLEGLHCGRRELALCSSSLSKAAAVLSSVEEHSSLSRALHQLAEATDRTHTVYHAQADADFYILCETTRDYINLIGAAKEVLHERVKVYQAWHYAQTMCAKKREAKAKLELAARHDKISLAHQEVLDWESKVEKNKENFELISVTIKKELEQFDVQRVQDFKDMLVKYLEAMVTSQQQVIKVWEAFLPEAKAIS